MIFTNIQKPFNFHKINLYNNNIYLSNNQLKWLLQTIREEKFPNNNIYI